MFKFIVGFAALLWLHIALGFSIIGIPVLLVIDALLIMRFVFKMSMASIRGTLLLVLLPFRLVGGLIGLVRR